MLRAMEIRFHGRGGQGTVLAAKILADAIVRSGRGECLATPEFGVERRGAPVAAYARIAQGEIFERSRIYEPDAVILLDPIFAQTGAMTEGLKSSGVILANVQKEGWMAPASWQQFRVLTLPAGSIALKHGLGSPSAPMVNTAVCGAVVALFDLADFDSLERAIRESVPVKPDENVAAAKEAYRLMEGVGARIA